MSLNQATTETRIQRLRLAMQYSTGLTELRGLFPELKEDEFFLLYMAAKRMNETVSVDAT
jgi:hypothetical protein